MISSSRIRSMRASGNDIFPPPCMVRWIVSSSTLYASIFMFRPSEKSAMLALAVEASRSVARARSLCARTKNAHTTRFVRFEVQRVFGSLPTIRQNLRDLQTNRKRNFSGAQTPRAKARMFRMLSELVCYDDYARGKVSYSPLPASRGEGQGEGRRLA